jgi:hypothetical protein
MSYEREDAYRRELASTRAERDAARRELAELRDHHEAAAAAWKRWSETAARRRRATEEAADRLRTVIKDLQHDGFYITGWDDGGIYISHQPDRVDDPDRVWQVSMGAPQGMPFDTGVKPGGP